MGYGHPSDLAVIHAFQTDQSMICTVVIQDTGDQSPEKGVRHSATGTYVMTFVTAKNLHSGVLE
jgi:putative lipoic acid-binding regulatory protein